MPYTTVYDAASAGFDFRGLYPILGGALVVIALAVFALRKREVRRPIRIIVLGVVGTVVAVALAGVAADYRSFRLDIADLEAGRIPVAEGVIDRHELRRGGEHFDVDSVPLYARTALGGYGMAAGVAPIQDHERVRVYYSLRNHHRRHAVLRFATAPDR